MTERRKQPTVAETPSAMRTAEFSAERGSQADIDAARRLLRRPGGQPPDPSDRLDDPEV